MSRPIRVLELRSVRGAGGGPEKTILLGTAATDPSRFAITVCYLRDRRDDRFEMTRRAAKLKIDYVEIEERHSLDPAVWPQLRRLVRDRGIDIVHAHEYKSDLLAYMLSKVEPVIPLATAHAWTGHSWKERALYYPVDKWLLARFPKVIAVSSEIKRELAAWGARPDDVDVVLNGIDETLFRRDPARRAAERERYRVSPGDFVIGSVGRLEPQKRFDLLVEAFAAIHQARPDLRLIIAGEGSERPGLEAQIQRLGLGSACRLAGQTSDVAGFHHALDLFVQSSMYEGTPNVVLEAMALETPLVATDVGGTAELMRHQVDGLIVPPLNLMALTSAIRAALDDAGARQQWTEAARRRVETDLAFRTRMARVEAIYEQLMHGRRPAPGGVVWTAPAKS
jgi:glycosyltransferase involved in cell wall biosynthesis